MKEQWKHYTPEGKVAIRETAFAGQGTHLLDRGHQGTIRRRPPHTTQPGLDIYPQWIHYRNMAKKSTGQAPLTPAVLHILLALSAGERHGYGIMKQVEADSEGKVKMGPGTLYGSMGRMMEAGLIRESDKRIDPEMTDERRIYYKLTGAGRAALGAELKRYRGVVAAAEGRLAYGQ
jgi:DNA-binding PadR family transcriptional regulator